MLHLMICHGYLMKMASNLLGIELLGRHQPHTYLYPDQSLACLSKSKRYSDLCAYKGPNLWLDLHSSIRSEPDQIRFKALLKQKGREDLISITSVFD